MKHLPFLLAAMLVSLVAQADTYTAARVPATNLLNWTVGERVGVRGGISNRAVSITVTDAPYNANNSGTVDASSAVQSALNAAASGTAVYMPAGLYKWSNNVTIPSGVTLRGAGVSTQILVTNTCNQAIVMGNDSSYLWNYPTFTNWASGITRGSTNISVLDGTSFAAGMMVRLQWEIDTNLHFAGGGGGGKYVLGPQGFLYSEMKVIDAISNGTNLTIWPPIYCGTNAPQRCKAQLVLSQTTGAGLESLYINGTNGNSINIKMEQTYNCYVTNVIVRGTTGYGLSIISSLFFEMNYNDLRHRIGGGSNGAELLMNYVSGCYIVNNIIAHNFPVIEMNSGSSGNVIAHNFLYAADGGGACFDSNHGPHNAFNLIEGNMMASLISDGFFGGESHETVHRNWMFGIGPGITNTFQLGLKRWSRYFGFEQNVIGLALSPQTDLVDALRGEPNIGNSGYIGTASPMNGDWNTNYITYGIITNRVDANNGGITVLTPAGTTGIVGADNIGGGANPFWFGVTPIWDGITYPSYFYGTNITSTYIQIVNGSGGDALPADGTAVRVWWGSGLSLTASAPNQELDQDVSNTVAVANNWLIPVGVPSYQSVSGSTNSYYTTTKPSFFPTTYAWPAIGADIINATPGQTNQTLTNYVLIPAQSAFLNPLAGGIGSDWPDNDAGGGTVSGDGSRPGNRGKSKRR